MSLQVAFIIAGCTHATYYKALSHSLGIDTVSAPTFMCTIRAMHYIVESMLDEVCEAAKQEMRDVKESELGLWQNAVTVADSTWQTRGWHSKNATFTIRNYLTGALLYYHHLCQKYGTVVVHLQYGGSTPTVRWWYTYSTVVVHLQSWCHCFTSQLVYLEVHSFNCLFPYSKLLLEFLLVRVCVHPSELCISHVTDTGYCIRT